MTGCCEHDDEPPGSDATELVSYAIPRYSEVILSNLLHSVTVVTDAQNPKVER
jgi:hypothetical protein